MTNVKIFVVAWVCGEWQGETLQRGRDAAAAIRAFRREYRFRTVMGVRLLPG